MARNCQSSAPTQRTRSCIKTERYNEEAFDYEVPSEEERGLVLVLKFAESYFAKSQQKVFDVRLNGRVVGLGYL